MRRVWKRKLTIRGLPAEERKNLILDQAQRLFVERGFAATTVEDILNRAGIAKGTLYHHFSGKEDTMSIVQAWGSRITDRHIGCIQSLSGCLGEVLERVRILDG